MRTSHGNDSNKVDPVRPAICHLDDAPITMTSMWCCRTARNDAEYVVRTTPIPVLLVRGKE